VPWSPGPRRGRLGRPAVRGGYGARCGGCCCRTARRRPGRAPPAGSAAQGTWASGCRGWRLPAPCCGPGVSCRPAFRPKPPFRPPLQPRAASRRPTLRIFFSSFLCCHSSVRVVCGGPESLSWLQALCRGRQDLGAAGWGARLLGGATPPAAADAAVCRQDGGLGAPRRQNRRLGAPGRAGAAAGGCRRPAAGLGWAVAQPFAAN